MGIRSFFLVSSLTLSFLLGKKSHAAKEPILCRTLMASQGHPVAAEFSETQHHGRFSDKAVNLIGETYGVKIAPLPMSDELSEGFVSSEGIPFFIKSSTTGGQLIINGITGHIMRLPPGLHFTGEVDYYHTQDGRDLITFVDHDVRTYDITNQKLIYDYPQKVVYGLSGSPLRPDRDLFVKTARFYENEGGVFLSLTWEEDSNSIQTNRLFTTNINLKSHEVKPLPLGEEKKHFTLRNGTPLDILYRQRRGEIFDLNLRVGGKQTQDFSFVANNVNEWPKFQFFETDPQHVIFSAEGRFFVNNVEHLTPNEIVQNLKWMAEGRGEEGGWGIEPGADAMFNRYAKQYIETGGFPSAQKAKNVRTVRRYFSLDLAKGELKIIGDSPPFLKTLGAFDGGHGVIYFLDISANGDDTSGRLHLTSLSSSKSSQVQVGRDVYDRYFNYGSLVVEKDGRPTVLISHDDLNGGQFKLIR